MVVISVSIYVQNTPPFLSLVVQPHCKKGLSVLHSAWVCLANGPYFPSLNSIYKYLTIVSSCYWNQKFSRKKTLLAASSKTTEHTFNVHRSLQPAFK